MEADDDELKEDKSENRTKGKKKEIKKIKGTRFIPTHITTLEMLKENLSIESIAEKRGVSVGTIINHIEKLQRFKTN